MCTVTYIPTDQGVYLTSNRDESNTRAAAQAPAQHRHNGTALLYPKDAHAGGSWIAMKQNGDAAVLLNGAFTRHSRQPHYRKSRGVIFLEIIGSQLPVAHFTTIDLQVIEPFTLIIFTRRKLWECRWDGMTKHALQLNASQPHIWSSATLYDHKAAEARKRWFHEWYHASAAINAKEIMRFHRHAGKEDKWNGLVIDRNGQMQTVSITCLAKKDDHSEMHYLDLKKDELSNISINGVSNPPRRSLTDRVHEAAKKLAIRITNREYWPSWTLYAPVLPYWCWLSIRSRSLLFFSGANPSIEHGGFIMEKKSDIYQLIPAGLYPRTKLCKAGVLPPKLHDELEQEHWHLPLIAKPNIGEKGKKVKVITTVSQLEEYILSAKVDFLLQELITYPNEAGIFYYRMPGEKKGKISGIVGKELLSVTGDGRSTIESLLKKNDRALLQLATLRKTEGALLQTVLQAGECATIVPYGNHARGARFTDLKDRITPRLSEAIDHICKQIPGFFYGRLDIRFSSWEELEKGINFSIIEVNGAGSEPTHIYDPAHSIFFAWKEVCRHWSLMQRISRLNVQMKQVQLLDFRGGIRLISERRRYMRVLEGSQKSKMSRL